MEIRPLPKIRIVDVQSYEGFRLNGKSYHDAAFWKCPQKICQSISNYPRRALGKTSLHWGNGDRSPTWNVTQTGH